MLLLLFFGFFFVVVFVWGGEGFNVQNIGPLFVRLSSYHNAVSLRPSFVFLTALGALQTPPFFREERW